MLKATFLGSRRIISQRSLRLQRTQNIKQCRHKSTAVKATITGLGSETQSRPSVSEELDAEPSFIKAKFRDNLKKERQRALMGGGEDRVAKQHAKGSLTARERVALLFDDGSFREMDQMKVHRCQEFGMDSEENKIPGDGVVTGHVSFSCALLSILLWC